MRTSACILILSLLATACSRHAESAVSHDDELQKKLAGVWVCNQKSPLGQEIIDTIELSADGTYAAVHKLPNRKLGPRTIEENGTWRIEDGALILTQKATSVSEDNDQLPSVEHVKIVRSDDRELEVAFAPKIDGFSATTNRFVFRRQAR